MVTEQIGKYIAKYEEKETDLNYNANEFKLIGEFLTDLNALLKYAQEKQAACCEQKGKQIPVTACRNCSFFTSRALMPDYCSHPKEVGGRDIDRPDAIPGWCKL